MRLKVSVAAANEQLLTLVTAGYQLDGKLRQDRQTKKATGTFNEQEARSFHGKEIEGWMEEVLTALDGIFPTDRECHVFMNPDSNLGRVSSDDYQWTCMMLPFMDKIKGLDRLRQTAIAE